MSIETLITVPFPDLLIYRLQGISPKLNIVSMPIARAEDIPTETWSRVEVLYTAGALPTPEQALSLRWVQFHFAGVDRFVTHPLLQREDLLVTTLSGAAMSQMAEYVVTMMLALGRKLPALSVNQKKAEWPKDRYERFVPFELRGKTVGIVGYGSIGRQVARLLQPFGVTTLAAKFNAMQPADRGYALEGLGDPQGDMVHRIYPFQALASMFKECHFVVVTVPLTPQTQGLINAKVLNALKPGAYLIDISRGGVIDQAALLEALKNGKIAGAALDVFAEEPLPAHNPLWQMPNVIVTPHISGSSIRYEERALDLFSENLHRYLGGLPLYNLFDRHSGY